MNTQINMPAQELLKNYFKIDGKHPCKYPFSLSINLETLLTWLNEEQTKLLIKTKKQQKEREFVFASFRAELLRDLFNSMIGDKEKIDKQKRDTSEGSNIKLLLLTASGILVAACQGFDGIVSMLSIFSLSSYILLGAGFTFSFFSIVVFCSVDLTKVAHSLGVTLGDTYKLLNAYLLQLQNIKMIRKKISHYNLGELSSYDLINLDRILCTLKKCYFSLIQESKQFEEALHSGKMKIIQLLLTSICALLFFGGGVFAGQSVALFVLSLINVTSPLFWPVILFSTLVGLAAFSLYWYVERPEINKLINGWFGLNEKKVHKLCDQDLFLKETKKIENLQEKIKSMIKVNDRVVELEKDLHLNEVNLNNTANGSKVSTSVYSFFNPRSLSESSLELYHSDKAVSLSLL